MMHGRVALAPYRRRRPKAVGSTVGPAPAAPDTPGSPFPADGDLALFSRLSWVSARATKYDIYLDTVSPPARIVVPKYVGTSYRATLQPNTRYYWKIVAFNDGGSATGPIWSFTTPKRLEVFVALAGNLITVPASTLSIREQLGASPNTASCVVGNPAPADGQAVKIGLGGLDPEQLLFGGSVQALDHDYVGTPRKDQWTPRLIDHTFQVNKRRPYGSWTDVSASTIGRYLVTVFGSGCTGTHIQDGLPNVSINFDGSQSFMACLSALAAAMSDATAVGRGYIDYSRDVHLYRGIEPDVISPDPIDVDHPPLNDPPIKFSVDHSQMRTRVKGKGHGEQTPSDVGERETILPIADAVMFNPNGGQAVAALASGAAQTDILTYEGVQLGGGGSLVGPGAAPSVAPSVALAAGAGLGAGDYKYEYSHVTAAGESLPSPLATITVGLTAPPASAPSAGAATGGGSVDVGSHEYEATFVTASGETTPSPVSTAVAATNAKVTDPASALTFVQSATAGPTYDTFDLYFTYAYSTATSPTDYSTMTAVSPNSAVWPGSSNPHRQPTWTIPYSTDAAVKWIVVFYTFTSGGGPFTPSDGSITFANNPAGGNLVVTSPAWGGAVSNASGNTTPFVSKQTIPVSGIPLGGPSVTGRKLYRRFNGTGTFALVTTIADNTTTTYSDTTANASLGAAAPSANTATANQVLVSAISTGQATVTARKLYRTTVGGSQPKLVTTLTDNVTTTYADSVPDGSLGANAPVSDTSGLTQPAGQVNAGSVAIPVASPAPYSESGGWASVSGGQTVRYSTVGQAYGPAAPLTLSVQTGAPGPGPGTYLFAYAFGTALGTSLLSPPVAITLTNANQFVRVDGFLAGPTGTTSRTIYRSAANGTALFAINTFADNTTLGPWDTFAPSLGAPAPALDTSGLGGRYLLGIPATGTGSIMTTVLYGSPIVPSPALVGINKWNGLPRAIAKGSSINIFVQRDDLDAQAALGLLELDDNGIATDGIREYTITDERRDEASLIALCDADLATFSRPIVSTVYDTRDSKTHVGLSVPIDLAVGSFDLAFYDTDFFDADRWGLSGAFTIQSVDVTFPDGMYRARVGASSVAFRLSDLMRRAVIAA